MLITKKKPRGDSDMNLLESKIRMTLLDCMAEPRGCVKTDIIIYKHGAGRINFWHSVTNSNNLDIISYYFTYKNDEIVVYDDFKVVKMLKS